MIFISYFFTLLGLTSDWCMQQINMLPQIINDMNNWTHYNHVCTIPEAKFCFVRLENSLCDIILINKWYNRQLLFTRTFVQLLYQQFLAICYISFTGSHFVLCWSPKLLA